MLEICLTLNVQVSSVMQAVLQADGQAGHGASYRRQAFDVWACCYSLIVAAVCIGEAVQEDRERDAQDKCLHPDTLFSSARETGAKVQA